MDNLEAKIIKRNQSGVAVSITNPTQYDAIISILSESSLEAKKPLPLNGFINWQKVNERSGKRKQFILIALNKNRFVSISEKYRRAGVTVLNVTLIN